MRMMSETDDVFFVNLLVENLKLIEKERKLMKNRLILLTFSVLSSFPDDVEKQ